MTVDLDPALGCLRLDEIASFLVLAEELHFARAAGRLGLSPGGLSRRISHLERVLGGPLLVRTTRSVRLTPYGGDFREGARRLLEVVLVLSPDHPRDLAASLPAAPL